MKQLECETAPPSHSNCARELLELVPAVMRSIRSDMRTGRSPELSVPQFRTPAFISLTPSPRLSHAAQHIHLTLPSMSKTVDGLVARNFIQRTTDERDRRRIVLTVTEKGRRILDRAIESSQAHLSSILAPLSEPDRSAVMK